MPDATNRTGSARPRRATPAGPRSAVLRVSSLAPAAQALARLAAVVAGRGEDPVRGEDSVRGTGPGWRAGHPRRNALLLTGAVGAVVGAGVAASRHRQRPTTVDPWVAATAPRTGLLSASDEGRPVDPGSSSPDAP